MNKPSSLKKSLMALAIGCATTVAILSPSTALADAHFVGQLGRHGQRI